MGLLTVSDFICWKLPRLMSKPSEHTHSRATFGSAYLIARQRHAAHYHSVLNHANQLYLNGGNGSDQGLAVLDREWSNIDTGHTWAAARSETNAMAATLCIDYVDTGGEVLSWRQHPQDRIRWLEVAATAARGLGKHLNEGICLGNLANAYAELGQLRRALEFCEQALVISRKFDDRTSEGAILGNAGNIYAQMGEVKRAIESYEQALLISREVGDQRAQGVELSNLGLAYAMLGEMHRAIEFYEQALTIDRETGDRRSEGQVFSNLGTAYADIGETRRAIKAYERGLAIARELGDRRAESVALSSLGTT